MRRFVIPLIALAALAAPAAADDDTVQKALAAFQEAFASEHAEDRAEAVAALREHEHPLVVEILGKRALVDTSPEVRDVAAQVLGRMTSLPDSAGPILRDHLARNDKSPVVQVSIIRAIARLGFEDARKELQEALRKHFREEEYQWVTKEVLDAFATLKDVQSLPFLLRLYEYKGKCPPRAKAPPGERGATDAEAKAKYEAKHGTRRAMPKGKAETVDALWWQHLVDAVKVLTGQEFEDAKAFEAWLKANAKELGIDPKELRNRKRL